MSKSFKWCGVALLMTGMTACDQQPIEVAAEHAALFSQAETQGAALATLRAATARYHNVDAALADGYRKDTPCLYNTVAGGRGFVYSSGPIDGIYDPLRPDLLFYEPLPGGQLRLAGVGFMVLAAVWDANNTSAPMFGNQPFIDRRVAPYGGPPFPNYVLFAWLWEHNPSGMYAPFNPQVSCEFTEDKAQR